MFSYLFDIFDVSCFVPLNSGSLVFIILDLMLHEMDEMEEKTHLDFITAEKSFLLTD